MAFRESRFLDWLADTWPARVIERMGRWVQRRWGNRMLRDYWFAGRPDEYEEWKRDHGD